MAKPRIQPTGRETLYEDDELIVSKTDRKGRITYVNRVFQRLSGYEESELLGKPHNIIRHPDMPRSVFKLLWDTLHEGDEVFAYIVNLSQNGDHYWVLAHVTPSFDQHGTITGYHSNRRLPSRRAVTSVKEIYASILREERQQANPKAESAAGSAALNSILDTNGVTYGEFVFSL